MSTKFISKNSNYMVVLTPGVEGNRNLGTRAVPGLYIKFLSGLVDIKEESVVEMMREHPSFGIDFVEVKPEDVDPYAYAREEIEPAHVISEIKYGHNEKAAGTAGPAKMSPQLRKLIEIEALKMLPDLLKSNPQVLQDVILGIAAGMKTAEASSEKIEDDSTEETTETTPAEKEEIETVVKPANKPKAPEKK
jgi:hypothetical protein